MSELGVLFRGSMATKDCAPINRSIGAGGWTRSGCSVATSNLTHTSCECDRPGVFAVVGEEKVNISNTEKAREMGWGGVGGGGGGGGGGGHEEGRGGAID